MNIIRKLYDEEYVLELFEKEILPKYSKFTGIEKIKTKKHKNDVWETTYHVVIEFETYFKKRNGDVEKLPIFCSAHSDEPRENAYISMKYLWDHSFSSGDLTIPRPLIYNKEFNAVFYRGVVGHSLLYYIKKNNFEAIENIIPRTAKLFAKLHSLPIDSKNNFELSYIKSVIPGRDKILKYIEDRYPEHYDVFFNRYNNFIAREGEFFSKNKKFYIIHGDAHPDNLIKINSNKLAFIDFVDICLSDFARDLGSFLQQLEYKIVSKIGDNDYAEQMKKMFLDNYINSVKINLDSDLESRIKNYYNWTIIRTATFFLLKHNPQPEKALVLLEQIK